MWRSNHASSTWADAMVEPGTLMRLKRGIEMKEQQLYSSLPPEVEQNREVFWTGTIQVMVPDGPVVTEADVLVILESQWSRGNVYHKLLGAGGVGWYPAWGLERVE